MRSDVSELHTAEKWVTNGREVVPVQLINPFKVVAKRGSKAKQKKALMKDAGEFDEVCHSMPSIHSHFPCWCSTR